MPSSAGGGGSPINIKSRPLNGRFVHSPLSWAGRRDAAAVDEEIIEPLLHTSACVRGSVLFEDPPAAIRFWGHTSNCFLLSVVPPSSVGELRLQCGLRKVREISNNSRHNGGSTPC